MSLVNVSNLSVKYGKNIVLQNLKLSISAGEIVTIVGPNGSGKTTLFKAIIGTAAISAGTIEKDPSLKIGYVPQQINIDRTLPLTVERFLSLVKSNDDKSFSKALEHIGIKHLAKTQMSKLSGGELQRVLLSHALVNKPNLLLLDEATRGLDQSGSASFYRKIEEIRNDTGCAVLMISHDLHVVMGASDRVICLNGHICCQGAPDSVASSPEYKALFGSELDGTFALYKHKHDHHHDSES